MDIALADIQMAAQLDQRRNGSRWHIWLLVVGRRSKTRRGLILDRELSADLESVWVSAGETRLDGGDEGGLNEVSGTRG